MTAGTPSHAGVATRWGAMPIAEQLAHVGSEVERTLRAREAFCAQLFTPGPDAGPDRGLRRYFLAFAVLARRTGMGAAR